MLNRISLLKARLAAFSEDASRKQKSVFLAILDIALVTLSLLFTLLLISTKSDLNFNEPTFWILAVCTICFSASVGWFLKIPGYKLSSFDTSAIVRVAVNAGANGLLIRILTYVFEIPLSSVHILNFCILFFGSVVFSRIIGQRVMRLLLSGQFKRTAVAIYGTDVPSVQLALALHQDPELKPIAFIDPNPGLRGLIISGLNVYTPEEFEDLVPRLNIKRLLISTQHTAAEPRKALMDQAQALNVQLQTLPSFSELLEQDTLSNRLRTIEPEELLGRDQVNLGTPVINQTYKGRNVLVTGAGGSIGGELCRQLLDCKPSKIVLLDHSEFALYQILEEILPLAEPAGIKIVSCLATILNSDRIETILEEENVQVVLHAAAYKHVPLVEENEIEGARNNTLGTLAVAKACAKLNVSRFILISTDKAVRPTNIMGATKHMAELLVQHLHQSQSKTKFSIVRFGNVLGTSGSVLPRFQKQIEMGGPVTVTHRDIERYFMTKEEAAQLVLLAGAFSKGGEIFVLDMGTPIQIYDVARRMIELAGSTPLEEDDKGPGIRIKVTGLRPAEKMYEELFTENETLTQTPHAKIKIACDKARSDFGVELLLRDIEAAIAHDDPNILRDAIARHVKGYQPPLA